MVQESRTECSRHRYLVRITIDNLKDRNLSFKTSQTKNRTRLAFRHIVVKLDKEFCFVALQLHRSDGATGLVSSYITYRYRGFARQFVRHLKARGPFEIKAFHITQDHEKIFVDEAAELQPSTF